MKRTRRVWVLLATVALLVLSPLPASEARFATGGVGRFLNSINWIEWGAAGETIPATGKTVVETRKVGEYDIQVTCVISQPPSGSGFGGSRTGMRVYTPGSYFQDGLDDIYHIGGPGKANKMTVGVANVTPGALVRFKLECSSTVQGPGLPPEGMQAPLDGLVFADAESSNRTGRVGSLQAEASPETDWYVIDRHRNARCTQHTMAILSSRATEALRLEPSGMACPSGPTAVAFMRIPPVDGVTTAVISVQGEGASAVALGVVQNFDFGDAPVSYGNAAARYQPTWEGQALPVGTTNTFDFPLADMGNPPVLLGNRITPDQASNTVPDDGDDGFSQTSPRPVIPGRVSQEKVTCSGSGHVRGWIDWNSNGVFDDAESSDTVACDSGSAELTWRVPEDVVSAYPNNNQPGGRGETYLRLRAARTAAELVSPTGFTPSGEVEDHPYTLMLAELRVDKTSDALAGRKFVGDVVTYDVEATNIAPDAFIDSYPAHVFDDLNGLLDDAEFIPDSLRTTIDGAPAPSPAVYDSRTGRISWHGPLRSQSTVRITYQVRVRLGGDRQIGNVAWGQHGGPETPLPGVDCAPRSDSGWDASPEVPCARVDHRLLSLVKKVESSHDDQPDPPSSWLLTATGDFGGEAGDTTRTVEGAGVVTEGNTFVVPATGEFTFSEAAKPWQGAGYSFRDAVWDKDSGVVTFTNVDAPAALRWRKIDALSSAAAPGSAWVLEGGSRGQRIEVEDCVAADARDCTGQDRDPAPGALLVTGLGWGSYTLTERTAPPGYRLDGTVRPVRIQGTATVQPHDLGGIRNERLPGEVTWQKTAAGTDELLAGAEFRLSGPQGIVLDVADCVAASAQECAGPDRDPEGGRFRVTELGWGAWRLVESRAPLGYVLGTREVDLDIGADALTHRVETPFRNTRTVLPTLPLTGGTAAELYLLGGGAFVALAAVLITYRRIRANRQVSHTMEGTS
ncbi:MAG: CshA/CshB family fibrillar adhesin-related protein [Arachnia propionica]|uniref:CshA/CshB family fibrillar adhesin-related protein n=1 Tax=Arachnia propionica TaxID=1750 RepID=UPI0026FBD6A5|nr:CshA/CshB family fibrillar adhesin-related protein [Arachnia propionica]